MSASLPTDARERKAAPMAEGLLWYFPNALAEVARVSKAGNDQHNPGQPMHWARGKSMDHADCIIRHLVDAGTVDTDGQRHSAKVAWRALALLQEELERECHLPAPRNAWADSPAAAMREAKVAYDWACERGARLPKWHPSWPITPPNCDGLSARDIRAPHPMAAEAIRDHDERLVGGESHL